MLHTVYIVFRVAVIWSYRKGDIKFHMCRAHILFINDSERMFTNCCSLEVLKFLCEPPCKKNDVCAFPHMPPYKLPKKY